jgi:predicted transcriptional regulator
MAEEYVVVAGGLVAKMKNDTGEGYLYKGDQVPEAVPADEVKRLEEMGLIEQVGGQSRSKAAGK